MNYVKVSQLPSMDHTNVTDDDQMYVLDYDHKFISKRVTIAELKKIFKGGSGFDSDVLGKVSVLRPKFEGRLFLKLNLYSDQEMSHLLGTINSRVSSDLSLFKALLINNIDSTESDPSGTQWKTPTIEGLGPEYSNSPVVVQISDRFSAFHIDLSTQKKIYIRYEWYSVGEDGTLHVSDHYSTVFPSFSETGAIPGVSGNKSVRASKECAIVEDDNGYKFYGVNSDSLNIVSSYSDDIDGVALLCYNDDNEYELKITTDGPASIDIYIHDLDSELIRFPSDRDVKVLNLISAGKYLVKFYWDTVTIIKI